MHIPRRDGLALDEAVFVNTRVNRVAIGGFQIAATVFFDMPPSIRVALWLTVLAFARPGLRLLKRTYERMQEHGLLAESEVYDDQHDVSFHYTPYNFDSEPERSLFAQVLSILKTNPDDVEAFLFTGGLTDPNKTDFHFEYLGEDKRYHRYFPDFVLVKKSGEFYIIEIKAEDKRGDTVVEAKKKAVERLQKMQPDKFKYNIVYATTNSANAKAMKPIKDWINSP